MQTFDTSRWLLSFLIYQLSLFRFDLSTDCLILPLKNLFNASSETQPEMFLKKQPFL